MNTGIPAEFISGYYEEVSKAGLPIITEAIEEIIYRACEAGFPEESLNAIRYYDVSSRVQRVIYDEIARKGRGLSWEMEFRTPDHTYIIGCHSN